MVDVWLAEPRGFCAGVCRALSLVEKVLNQYGAPIYVRHEIVHNKHVISSLQNKGVIFVEEIDDADVSRPLILSAHGVSKSVIERAKSLGFNIIDATCPLVSKVHHQIKKYASLGMNYIVIGKKEHPEVIGTLGQVDDDNVVVISKLEDVEKINFNNGKDVGFVTQTTLSVDETKEIVAALKLKFPKIISQKRDDICFATTNRQKAVKAISEKSEVVIIIGSKNSSNSKQLQNVATSCGVNAYLVDDVSELDLSKFKKIKNIGISAGASAPEHLVEELLSCLQEYYDNINIHNIIITKENREFNNN